MRKITHLVVHCSATHPQVAVEAIQRYWREVKGWKSPGYHIIIEQDGTPVRLAEDDQITNGVAGHNSTSLHVCYIGGVITGGENTIPYDTRSRPQKYTLLEVLKAWRAKYPESVIQGHRDFLGVSKACPSFDARLEYGAL